MSNVISLEDFNTNFITHIRSVERDHTDETGTYPYGVGFNVICKPNNRVMYFETHMDSNMAPSGTPEVNVVNIAWSNLLPDIKSWASAVISSSNLLGSIYTPTLEFANTSNIGIDLATYNSNFNTVLSRFEVYPATNPRSWCVAYNVNKIADSNETHYFDTSVIVNTFAVQRAETEIMDLAWSNMRDSIGQWAGVKMQESVMINTQFTSSNW